MRANGKSSQKSASAARPAGFALSKPGTVGGLDAARAGDHAQRQRAFRCLFRVRMTQEEIRGGRERNQPHSERDVAEQVLGVHGRYLSVSAMGRADFPELDLVTMTRDRECRARADARGTDCE